MRRIGLWLASTVAVLALLLGYHTSTSGVLSASSQAPIVSGGTAGTGGTGTATTAGSSGGHATSHSAKGSASTGSASATQANPKTYTGSVAQTRYGPVQVAVTVKSGTITKVSVLQYPNAGGMDQQINSYALPILVDNTVKAQSAQVQMVMATIGKLPLDNPVFVKGRTGFEGALRWLDENVGRLTLPARDLSLLEVALFCLVEHLTFRKTLAVEAYPALVAFARDFGTRPSAAATAYRFD